MIKKLFILVVVCFRLCAITAQQPHILDNYIHLGHMNGLPSNSVMKIEDDSLGRIWIGTNKGIAIYDGFHLEQIKELDGIKINDLHHTPQGMLIASSTFLSFYHYKTGRLSFIRYNQKDIKYANSFWQLNGDTYFIGDESLYVFRNGTISLLKKNLKSTLLTIDKYRTFWLADKTRIYHLDSQFQKMEVYPIVNRDAVSQRIVCIYADERGDVWAGTLAEGLYRFNRVSDCFELVKIATDASRHIIQNIGGMTSDWLDRLWIGYHNGISVYDLNNNSYQNYLFSNEYNININSTITTIHRTRSNNMVVGTYTNGIYYIIDSQPWMQHYYLKTLDGSFSGITGNALSKDKNGNIWIGTNCNGISILDASGRMIREINSSNQKIDNDIIGLTMDDRGTVWASSSSKGLYRIQGKGEFAHYTSSSSPSSLSGNTVYAIYAMNSDSLFIANNGGIDIMETTTGRFTPLLPPSQNYMEFFNITSRGNKIYTISINTIYCYDRVSKQLSQTVVRQNQATNFLQSCYTDKKGRLWVGNMQGELYILENNLLKKADCFKLPKTDICGISEDNNGNLWIATSEGLFVKDSTQAVSKYTIPLSERNNQFNIRSSYTDAEGNIYFGTTNGLLAIRPDQYSKTVQSVPVLYVSQFKLFNKVVKSSDNGILTNHIQFTDRITLKNYQDFISFVVSPILFKNRGTNEFTCFYRLEGFDPDWYEVNPVSNEVSFTGLKTGTYELHLKLVDKEGKAIAEKKLEIIVQPPFLLSLSMITIYLFILCILGYLAYRYFRDRLESRRLLLESKQEQLAIERLNNYKLDYFTLISQEFGAPLSVLSILQNEILSQDESLHDEILVFKRNIARLEYLMNQLMEFRSVEQGVITIHKTPIDMIDFIRGLIAAFLPLFSHKNIGIELKTESRELTIPLDRGKLEIILANLLSNIYHYSQKSVNGFIQVTPEDAYVELEIHIPGVPLTDEQRDTIFQPFSGHSDEMGYHLKGLDQTIVSCLVKQLGVTLEIINADENNLFRIRIPNHSAETVEVDDFPSSTPPHVSTLYSHVSTIVDNIIYEEKQKDAEALTFLSSHEEQSEEVRFNAQIYRILIVEPDSDVRTVLTKRLKQHYHILPAVNSENAWIILKSHPVDVVIANLSAGDNSCIDLCKQIKANKQLMQIPVIILFDINQKELRKKALEVRADAIYEKPLDIKEFQLSLDTILFNKRILRNHYIEMSKTQAIELVETNADEIFINKLTDYIVNNFNNSLSMSDLTQHLRVSRTQLYMHVKRIMGISPSEYILQLKMEEARKLLLSTKKSSAEISYELGYCNPNHFSKQFKDFYQVSPSVYRNQYEAS